MSLCLVLLLAAVGIDWWNGWKLSLSETQSG